MCSVITILPLSNRYLLSRICPDNVRALSVCPSSSTTIHPLFMFVENSSDQSFTEICHSANSKEALAFAAKILAGCIYFPLFHFSSVIPVSKSNIFRFKHTAEHIIGME